MLAVRKTVRDNFFRVVSGFQKSDKIHPRASRRLFY